MSQDLSLASAEKGHIIKVLQKLKGNVMHACIALGITKPTLYKKITDYKIDLESLRKEKK